MVGVCCFWGGDRLGRGCRRLPPRRRACLSEGDGQGVSAICRASTRALIAASTRNEAACRVMGQQLSGECLGSRARRSRRRPRWPGSALAPPPSPPPPVGAARPAPPAPASRVSLGSKCCWHAPSCFGARIDRAGERVAAQHMAGSAEWQLLNHVGSHHRRTGRGRGWQRT